MSYTRCTQVCSDPKIVLREKKSTFVADNPNRKSVHKTVVDGCYITGDDQRCDFMLRIDYPDPVVYLVELKGGHLDHAISQLESTLSKLPVCVRMHKKECCVVVTNAPSARTILPKLKMEFRKKYQSGLSVRTRLLTVEV